MTAGADIIVNLNSPTPVTLGPLNAGDSGRVLVTQIGAGAVTSTVVTTVNGDIQLVTTGAEPHLRRPDHRGRHRRHPPGHRGRRQHRAGGQHLAAITALGDSIGITAGGSINGAQPLVAGDVELIAGTGIRNTTAGDQRGGDLGRHRHRRDPSLISQFIGPTSVTSLTDSGAGNVTLVHTGGRSRWARSR